jgi:putative glycosyltransferase (TIGR04372 family)
MFFTGVHEIFSKILNVYSDKFRFGAELIDYLSKNPNLRNFLAAEDLITADLSFYNQEIATRLANMVKPLISDSIVRELKINVGEYVCLIVRDEQYFANRKGGFSVNEKFLLHNARNMRNSDISNYASLFEALSKRGLTVVRMGKGGKAMPDYSFGIDYANSMYQSLDNDLGLIANCAFVVSTGTGIDEAATFLCGKKVYGVNWALPGWIKRTPQIPLLLPKTFYSKNSRILEAAEYFQSELFLRKNYSEEVDAWNYSWTDASENELYDYSEEIANHYFFNILTENKSLQLAYSTGLLKCGHKPKDINFVPTISSAWKNYIGDN